MATIVGGRRLHTWAGTSMISEAVNEITTYDFTGVHEFATTPRGDDFAVVYVYAQCWCRRGSTAPVARARGRTAAARRAAHCRRVAHTKPVGACKQATIAAIDTTLCKK